MSAETPYTTTVVARAREHREAGWSITEIRRMIEREFGRCPQWVTVKGWVDEKYAERRRALARDANRRHMVRKTGRRPIRNVSSEWKLERMRELADRGVSLRAISQVAAVWWGEELTEHEVRRRLEGRHRHERRIKRSAA